MCQPTGACCAANRRWRGDTELRLRLPSPCGTALEPVAGIRSRRHPPVLCPALARSWHDQIDPAEYYRQRYRLALFERAQARIGNIAVQAARDFSSAGLPATSAAERQPGLGRRFSTDEPCGDLLS